MGIFCSDKAVLVLTHRVVVLGGLRPVTVTFPANCIRTDGNSSLN